MNLWHFVSLSQEELSKRRELLDQYASIAQASALVPLAIVQCYHLASSATSAVQERDQRSKAGSRSWLPRTSFLFKRFLWWTGDLSFVGRGTNGIWILGLAWTAWLLLLCVDNTADDYLHLAKRFGIVGASQLPLHFLLAWKSPYSPIQFLTRHSHEELNRYHRALGRIVTFLFLLHASFYLYFFVLSGLLAKRVREADVILGICGVVLFGAIMTTSLRAIRTWSYRVFLAVHISGSLLLVPVLHFHVRHVRPYIWESAVTYMVGQILRYYNTTTIEGTITTIPDTNLVRIRIRIPSLSKASIDNHTSKAWLSGAAQHIYLSVPFAYSGISRSLVAKLLTNPFTIASLPKPDNSVVLIARTSQGTTKRIATIAAGHLQDEEPKEILLSLEGPYGASRYFPNFSKFSAVLLIAGGVGATFTVPLYRNIHSLQALKRRPRKLHMVWAVRDEAEARWGLSEDMLENSESDSNLNHNATASQCTSSIDVYVTRTTRGAARERRGTGTSHADLDDIQLSTWQPATNSPAERDASIYKPLFNRGRPDLGAIVSATFSDCNFQDKMAVIVCGPHSLAHAVREQVDHWVHRTDIFWHVEQFE